MDQKSAVYRNMDIVADLPLKNGECPVWNPVDGALYWADIPSGRMFRHWPGERDSHCVYSAGQSLGALAVGRDGSIVQGLEDGQIQIWREGEITLITDRLPGEEGGRFNDSAADTYGRLLIGTMPEENRPSRLYLFDLDGSHRILLHDVGESNGMAFSADGKTLFHTDTKQRTISRYEYDPETGALGEGSVWVRISEGDGVPDGLTIDENERLWSAHWGAGAVVCYDQGREVARISVPPKQVSSLTFGGRDLDELFITTAGGDEREKWGWEAGALFEEKLPISGLPRPLAAIGQG